MPDDALLSVLGRAAPSESSRLDLPLYSSRVPAGFPSPADDYVEMTLDPAALLVKRPAATFFVRASGPSMVGAGINDGDILVVDRSIEARHGDIIVAVVDGGLTVKRLIQRGNVWLLVAANPDYPDLPIDPELGVQIWGVVTFSITMLCSR